MKLRDDMTDALSKLNGVGTDFLHQLNAEVGAEHSITAPPVADYVADVEDMLFEAGRYLDKHSVASLINNTTTPTPAVKGCSVISSDDTGRYLYLVHATGRCLCCSGHRCSSCEIRRPHHAPHRRGGFGRPRSDDAVRCASE